MENRHHLARSLATLAIALVLAYLLYSLLQPFLLPLAIGAILTFICRPAYQAIHCAIGAAPLSALLTLLGLLIIIVLPFSAIITLLLREIADLHKTTTSQPIYSLDQLNRTLSSVVRQLGFSSVHIDTQGIAVSFIGFLQNRTTLLLGSLLSTLGTLALALISAFYLLQSHEQLKRTILRFSPLRREDSALLMQRTKDVLWATLSGNLVLVLLQCLCASLGYLLFGLSAPLLLGVLYGISSLIPTIGGALVWIPLALFQFALGNPGTGAAIICWAIVQVILLDNYLGPQLIQRRAQLHPFLILLGILGGVSRFGIAGIILGPTLVALGIVGLEIIHRTWEGHEKETPAS